MDTIIEGESAPSFGAASGTSRHFLRAGSQHCGWARTGSSRSTVTLPRNQPRSSQGAQGPAQVDLVGLLRDPRASPAVAAYALSELRLSKRSIEGTSDDT
jgi:hypothetical protein